MLLVVVVFVIIDELLVAELVVAEELLVAVVAGIEVVVVGHELEEVDMFEDELEVPVMEELDDVTPVIDDVVEV